MTMHLHVMFCLDRDSEHPCCDCYDFIGGSHVVIMPILYTAEATADVTVFF